MIAGFGGTCFGGQPRFRVSPNVICSYENFPLQLLIVSVMEDVSNSTLSLKHFQFCYGRAFRNSSCPCPESAKPINCAKKNVRAMKGMVEQSDKLCHRLRSNDPGLSVIRSYEIEDYDATKLVQLMDAARHSQHLKWMYIDLDYMKMNAWESLAAFVNLSRSIEKLWVWNLRSQIATKTEYISQFFSAMNPRAVSLQGFGIEMLEPDRRFLTLERACVENFFARNDTITIVNILCEARRHPQNQVEHESQDRGSSFLDCALSGLQRNDTVEYLILRHSDQSDDCCMQINPNSICEFFRYNQSVHTLSYLVGNSTRDAEALGASLKFNRRPRELCLHNMSEQAAMAFFAQLPGACKLETLTLRDCSFGTAETVGAFVQGVCGCTCLKKLDIELIPQGQSLAYTDRFLVELCPCLAVHSTLREVSIGNGRQLGTVGANALGESLSAESGLEEIELRVEEVTVAGAKTLASKIPSFRGLRSFHLRSSVMTRQSQELLLDSVEKNAQIKSWRIESIKVL